jgi:hypothetical protein
VLCASAAPVKSTLETAALIKLVNPNRLATFSLR